MTPPGVLTLLSYDIATYSQTKIHMARPTTTATPVNAAIGHKQVRFRRCYRSLRRATGGAMGERPTLLLTTRLGVRPLGVRGDPLHAVAGQLLSVIRRRLGDGPANLLADPQLREAGDGIDWYAARSGEIRRFADLSDSERAATLETVETRLNAIRSLGAVLKESTASEEARLIGRSLELATARPSDDFIFLVDGEPVIAAWGYEADAVAGLAAFAPPPVPVP